MKLEKKSTMLPKNSRPPESSDAPLPRLRSRRGVPPAQLFANDDEEETQPSQETQSARGPSPPPRMEHPASEPSPSSQPLTPQAAQPLTPQASTPNPSSQNRPQRHDGMKRPRPPISRGSSSTGLKFQPKTSITRKTKEEREAQEQAEEERRRSQLATQVIHAGRSRGARGPFRGTVRGGSFSGGLNSWRNNRTGIGQASGFLSGPTRGETHQRGKGGRRIGIEVLETISAATEAVKPELSPERVREKTSTSKTASDSKTASSSKTVSGSKTASGRAKATKVKREETFSSVIASDVESEGDENRINVKEISHISLIEDDSDQGEPSSKGKERQTSRPPLWAIRPVRLEREEHIERSTAVNTDASINSLDRLERKSKHKQGRTSDGERKKSLEKSIDKGKGKSKDIEFLRHKKVWKGAYQEGKDMGDEPQVKEEPSQDDAIDIVAVPDSITNESSPRPSGENVDDGVTGTSDIRMDLDKTKLAEPTAADISDPLQEGGPQAPLTIIKNTKKRRLKLLLGKRPPVFQSEEDRQEWDRYLQDQEAVAEELLQTHAVIPAAQEADGNASTNPEQDPPKTRRDHLIYMFQLPPTLPNLVDSDRPRATIEKSDKGRPVLLEVPKITSGKTPGKKGQGTQPSSKTPAFSSKTPHGIAASSSKPKEPAIKVENVVGPTHESLNPYIVRSTDTTSVPGGLVGYLVTYEVGNTVLTWGGIRYEVGRTGTGMLQNCVMVRKVAGEGNESNAQGKEGEKDKEKMKEWPVGINGVTVKGMGLVQGGFTAVVEWNFVFRG